MMSVFLSVPYGDEPELHKQASRAWNKRIHGVLKDLEFLQSKVEPFVYIKRTKRRLTIIALYVDDFFVHIYELQN
jgi:hypothetical protein